MKVAIAYEGCKKAGEKRYELAGKVACASFESIGEFYKRKEGVIAERYNVDEIGMRILNGDGASWIKHSITSENVHYQLDPFHKNKAIRENVSDENMREQIFSL